jgi:hypothetical protein
VTAAAWTFLAGVVSLLGSLFAQYFSAQAAAREAEKEFRLDQATFHGWVRKAVTDQAAANAPASGGAGNAWERTDPPAAPKA